MHNSTVLGGVLLHAYVYVCVMHDPIEWQRFAAAAVSALVVKYAASRFIFAGMCTGLHLALCRLGRLCKWRDLLGVPNASF